MIVHGIFHEINHPMLAWGILMTMETFKSLMFDGQIRESDRVEPGRAPRIVIWS